MDIEQVVAGIAQQPGVVLLLGASDRGKTTLCLQLANGLLEAGSAVAVVDADIGQSDLGAPATIAMSCLVKPTKSWDELTVEAGYFVGTTSPPGQEAWCVGGSARMVEAARARGAATVLVDTTGLVHGRYGRYLKGAKMEGLQPRHIVALQRSGELDHLLAGCPGSTSIWRLTPAVQVQPRDAKQRRLAREMAFRRAWHHGDSQLFPLEAIPCLRTRYRTGKPVTQSTLLRWQQRLGVQLIYGERSAEGEWAVMLGQEPLPPSFRTTLRLARSTDFEQRLVGLVGPGQDALTVGVLQKLHWHQAVAEVFCPPVEAVTSLVFGLLRVDTSGYELGYLQAFDT